MSSITRQRRPADRPRHTVKGSTSMGKKNFYAVKAGRTPGIYPSWAECEAQVKGHAGAMFKGFATRAEAEAFLGGAAPAQPTLAPAAKKPKPVSTEASAASSSTSAGAASSSSSAFTALMSASVSAAKGVGVKEGEIAIFTDGACAGNQNVAVTANPAGWGAVVVEGCLGAPPTGGIAVAELYGPVELTSTSPHFLGAEVGSNNTGELSAVCEALRWLNEEEAPGRPACICYDSEYASNQAQGIHKAHKNVMLSQRSRMLLAEARRRRPVRFLHVKGHSGHKWNDAADALANKGATGARSMPGGDRPAARPPAPMTEAAPPPLFQPLGRAASGEKRPLEE